MVLVDSSVWVDYFHKGDHSGDLTTIIAQNYIYTNELILSELIPVLKHRKENEVIAGLLSLPLFRLNIFWEGIRSLQILNLRHGINKVGIPDLIITQQCLEHGIELWTLDSHFKLIGKHTSLKLYTNRK